MNGPIEENRRPVLKHAELDSSPSRIRRNLKILDGLIDGRDDWMCRRVRLTFVELVAAWQQSFAGEPMLLTAEVLPGAIRISVETAARTLTDDDWDRLLHPAGLDLVNASGIERRGSGGRWFEFNEGSGPPARLGVHRDDDSGVTFAMRRYRELHEELIAHPERRRAIERKMRRLEKGTRTSPRNPVRQMWAPLRARRADDHRFS